MLGVRTTLIGGAKKSILAAIDALSADIFKDGSREWDELLSPAISNLVSTSGLLDEYLDRIKRFEDDKPKD